MRIASGLLALGVTAGAAAGLRSYDPAQTPGALAFAALNSSPPDAAKAIRLYTEALRTDSANPYRWADLGGALLTAADVPRARYCFRRAIELGGAVPQIRLRAANFHFEMDEPEEALRHAARVLEVVPDYDAVLFGYFDRFRLSPAAVLSQIGDNGRATASYTKSLIHAGKMDAASEAWRYATAKGFSDDRLTASYLDAMLAGRRYSEASLDWIRYLGPARGDYPESNLLFNGGFEREPTGAAFDWRIQPSPDFETTRETTAVHDGKWALRIQFHGTANVSYNNVRQQSYITAGRYSLTAWIRTEGITTDECPRLEIDDAEAPSRLKVETAPFCGTGDWNLVSNSFTISSATRLISVGVVRRPSRKFDNKVNGYLLIDSVRITHGHTE